MITTPVPAIPAPRSRQRPQRRGIDRSLVVAATALSAFGVVIVYSATRGETGDLSFMVRQSAFLVVGLTAMEIVRRIDYRLLRASAPAMAAVTAAVLVVVLSPLGTEVRGTKGWLQAFGISVQPAEFAKITVVIGVAALLTSRRRIDDRGRFVAVRFVAAIAFVASIAGLVLAGGETGSVLVYLAIVVGMFLAGGVPTRLIALMVLSAGLGTAALLTSDLLEPYQRDRLEAFVDIDADPLGAGYNQRQSLTAIGSGGLGGKGLFNGPQTQLRYLPEQQTDFIFAVVSEELGFAGGLVVVLVEGLILARVLAVARSALDPFGALLCAGVFSFIAFHVVQNVAMNLRLLPVTGIPLPFVSYGGSSLVATFLAIGIVQSVAAHRPADRAATVLEAESRALHGLNTSPPGPSRVPMASRRATGRLR